ncbi:MAG: GAF domain-containing protein [Chloroflexi bacterium CFX4]|nr:GAF domain-containing protein [Chloroflexi bacterium CFX4]MDL1923563.1 GAF domain-containing protein [Chloroflexi bacterium CFX3]
MHNRQVTEPIPYALIGITALLGIGALIVSANIGNWFTHLITLGDILYFALLYAALSALTFPVLGRLYAGIESVAVLSALLSIGPLGAIAATALGHTLYEVLLTFWESRTGRPHELPITTAIMIALNIALTSFALLAAAWLYFFAGGRLPLVTFDPANLTQYLLLFFAYSIVHLLVTIVVVRPSLTPSEKPYFKLLMLRFALFHTFSQLLALLVAAIYSSQDTLGDVAVTALILIAALITRNNEKNYRDLMRRVDELATLNNIGQTLSRNLTTTDLVENIYEQVCRVMDASIFYIAFYDPHSETVSFPLSVDNGVRRAWSPSPPLGITGHIIRTKKPLLLRGTLESTNAQLKRLGVERLGKPSRCFLGVPMLADGAVMGVMAVQSLTNAYAYDKDDLAMLEIIAAQAATALQNITLYENLFGIANKLALLNSVSSGMSDTFDLQAILQTACDVLQQVGTADSAVIFLFEPEAQTFSLGYGIDLPDRIQLELDETAAACLWSAFEPRTYTFINAVDDLPTEDAWRTYAHRMACSGLLALPLSVEAQRIGVAITHYRTPPTLEQNALELLSTFANQLAVSIANARHHADIEQRAQELTQMVNASRAFTASLDLPSIAERLFDDLERLCAPDAMTVRFLTPDNRLQVIASRKSGDLLIPETLPTVGSIAKALQTQHSYLSPELPEDYEQLHSSPFAQVLFIPTVNDGQAFGIVGIAHTQPTPIPSRVRQMAEALVNQAALAMRNAQEYQQMDTALEARVDELSAIESISRKISGALNLEAIISEVLRAALNHTAADLVSVLLLPTHEVDHRTRLERFLARDDIQFIVPSHAFEGVIGQVLRNGQPVRLDDTRHVPNYVQPTNVPMLSELCVPIVYKEQRVGVINLESRRPAAFNSTHQRFITNLAEHAAIALATTQLFQRLEYQINTLQHLRALSLEMLMAGSLSTTLNLLVNAVIKTIRNGSVHLLLHETRPPRGESLTVERPLLVPEDTGAYEVVRLPIQRGGQHFGSFIISLDDPADLGDNRIHALEMIAIQAAIAIQNARLFEEVRARRDQMQTVFDSAREGMLLISGDGILLLANRAAEHLLNAPLNRAQGQAALSLSALAPLNAALAEGLPREPSRRHYRLEVSEVPRDIEETTVPVLDNLNQPVGKLLVLRDITQEEALKQFQQEISNMLVHDLRGPMTSVISSLRLLNDLIAIQDYSDLGNVIEIALTSANSQLDLIESLLDIARLERRQMPINIGVVALPDLVANTLQAFEAAAYSANIRLVNQIAPNVPSVAVDREQIKRVLFNLLDNAIRHTPSGGQIRVSASLERITAERMLTISVTDTGKGIPPEQRTRIFEKFVQISKSAVRGHRGSGLGLTFCRLAVEAHGGKIWVESGAEGGAAFSFTLPLAVRQPVPMGD